MSRSKRRVPTTRSMFLLTSCALNFLLWFPQHHASLLLPRPSLCGNLEIEIKGFQEKYGKFLHESTSAVALHFSKSRRMLLLGLTTTWVMRKG